MEPLDKPKTTMPGSFPSACDGKSICETPAKCSDCAHLLYDRCYFPDQHVGPTRRVISPEPFTLPGLSIPCSQPSQQSAQAPQPTQQACPHANFPELPELEDIDGLPLHNPASYKSRPDPLSDGRRSRYTYAYKPNTPGQPPASPAPKPEARPPTDHEVEEAKRREERRIVTSEQKARSEKLNMEAAATVAATNKAVQDAKEKARREANEQAKRDAREKAVLEADQKQRMLAKAEAERKELQQKREMKVAAEAKEKALREEEEERAKQHEAARQACEETMREQEAARVRNALIAAERTAQFNAQQKVLREATEKQQKLEAEKAMREATLQHKKREADIFEAKRNAWVKAAEVREREELWQKQQAAQHQLQRNAMQREAEIWRAQHQANEANIDLWKQRTAAALGLTKQQFEEGLTLRRQEEADRLKREQIDYSYSFDPTDARYKALKTANENMGKEWQAFLAKPNIARGYAKLGEPDREKFRKFWEQQQRELAINKAKLKMLQDADELDKIEAADFLGKQDATDKLKQQREVDEINSRQSAKLKDEEEAMEMKEKYEAAEERKQRAAEELNKLLKVAELKKLCEAELKKQREIEETKKRREAEELERQQEAYELERQREAKEIKGQQEADDLKKQQEADELKKQHEAEELRKQRRAIELKKQKQQEYILVRRKAEANELKKQQEAKERQIVADALKKRQDADARRMQQEQKAKLDESIQQQRDELPKRAVVTSMFDEHAWSLDEKLKGPTKPPVETSKADEVAEQLQDVDLDSDFDPLYADPDEDDGWEKVVDSVKSEWEVVNSLDF